MPNDYSSEITARITIDESAARVVGEHEVGSGLLARKSRSGSTVCVIAIGKMLEAAQKAADVLAEDGVEVTVWDARCCAPLDSEMIATALD